MIRAHYRLFINNLFILSPTYKFDQKWQVVRRIEGLNIKWWQDFNMKTIGEIYTAIKSARQNQEHTLLVLDDLTRGCRTAGTRAEARLDRIIANCRWYNCTIIQSVQRVVHATPEMRVNWECMITYYPENVDESTAVYKTCGFGRKQEFDQLLRYCTREPYSFLFIRRDGPSTHYFRNFTPLAVYNGREQIK